MTANIEDLIRAIVQVELRNELAKQRHNLRIPNNLVPGLRLPQRDGEVERQYSVKSAADLLEVSVQYIYDRMDDGELPRRLDLGGGRGKYRIPATDLQTFIDNRTSDWRK